MQLVVRERCQQLINKGFVVRSAELNCQCSDADLRYTDQLRWWSGSGVTERLGTLGHIDTRGPFTVSPVTLMSV